MSIKRFLLIVPLLVALMACSPHVVDSNGNPTTPVVKRADPVPVGKGWAFTTSDGAGEVTVYAARWAADSGGALPEVPSNGAYLVMDVGVSVSTGGYVVNEFEWTATDTDGRAWPCLSKHWFDPFLPNGEVKAGSQVRGNMACDMPQSAAVVRVHSDLGWSVPA